MVICYVDEAGDPGCLPSATADIQPVLVVAGFFVRQPRIAQLTREFIELKRQFHPAALPPKAHPLDWVLVEVKGAELRRDVALGSRRRRRHVLGFLDKAVALLERFECRLVGRVWVKGVGAPFKGVPVYTSSVQYVYGRFNRWLADHGEGGVVICDSREQVQNRGVSHSIFTEKFRVAGDKYPLILEMPMFGHSENHAGIQLADLVCSALLFPMAVDAYCVGFIDNTHVRKGYDVLRARYGPRLEKLQERVWDRSRVPPRKDGGVIVSDPLGKKSRGVMFSARDAAAIPAAPGHGR